MKLKKHLGAMLLQMVSLFINKGVASMFGVGIEEMPASLKNER